MAKVEDKDIRRVIHMEELFVRVKLLMNQIEDMDELYEEICDDVMDLEDYLNSPEWQEDYERHERGEFPDGLMKDVLSEDAMCDLSERFNELEAGRY